MVSYGVISPLQGSPAMELPAPGPDLLYPQLELYLSLLHEKSVPWEGRNKLLPNKQALVIVSTNIVVKKG